MAGRMTHMRIAGGLPARRQSQKGTQTAFITRREMNGYVAATLHAVERRYRQWQRPGAGRFCFENESIQKGR